jgi:hypothetical protein
MQELEALRQSQSSFDSLQGFVTQLLTVETALVRACARSIPPRVCP